MATAATRKTAAAKKTAPSFSVSMDHSKSTKGTHVFTNDTDETPITTLYIKRAAFTGDPPATITVTVEGE